MGWIMQVVYVQYLAYRTVQRSTMERILKTTSLCLAVVGLVHGVSAQTGGAVVALAGPSFSMVSSDWNFYTDHQTFRSGFNFGAGYRYRLSPHWSVQAAALAEQKGFLINGDIAFTDVNGNLYRNQSMTIRFHYAYFSLPVLLRFNTSGKTYTCATAGLVPSLLNKAIVKIPGLNDPNTGEELIPASETDYTEDYQQVDLGARLSIGAGRRINDRILIDLNLEYTHGLINMWKEGAYKDHLLNRSAALMVHVAYALKSGTAASATGTE